MRMILLYTYINIQTHSCTRMHLHTCTHAPTDTHTPELTNTTQHTHARIHTHTRMHAHAHTNSPHTHITAHTCTHASTHSWMHAGTHNARTHTRMHTRRTHVRSHTCSYTHTRTHAHTHMHTRTHAHTYATHTIALTGNREAVRDALSPLGAMGSGVAGGEGERSACKMAAPYTRPIWANQRLLFLLDCSDTQCLSLTRLEYKHTHTPTCWHCPPPCRGCLFMGVLPPCRGCLLKGMLAPCIRRGPMHSVPPLSQPPHTQHGRAPLAGAASSRVCSPPAYAEGQCILFHPSHNPHTHITSCRRSIPWAVPSHTHSECQPLQAQPTPGRARPLRTLRANALEIAPPYTGSCGGGTSSLARLMRGVRQSPPAPQHPSGGPAGPHFNVTHCRRNPPLDALAPCAR